MSDQLYKNKAQRHLNAADQLIASLTDLLIENISPKLSAQTPPAELKNDIADIFDKWRERFMPRHYNCDNGDNVLAMPYCTLHKDYSSRQVAQVCKSYIRIFQVNENRKVTIGNYAFGNTYQPDQYQELQNILQNGETAALGTRLESADGYKQLYFDRKEFEHLFMKKRFRHQSVDGMMNVFEKKLKHLGHKNYKNSHFDLSQSANGKLEQVIKLWSKAAEITLLGLADRQALRGTLLNTAPNENDYNWLTFPADPVIRDRRLGAYISQPGLTSGFARATMRIQLGPDDYFNKIKDIGLTELSDQIDEGKSVPQALKNLFSVEHNTFIPKKYLSPFHGLNDTVFDEGAVQTLADNFNTLVLLDYSEYPKEKKDWKQFKDFSTHLWRVSQSSELPFKKLVDRYRTDLPDEADEKQSWRDIGDFVKKIHNSILIPLIAEKLTAAAHISEPMARTEKMAHSPDIQQQFLSLLTIPQIIRGSRDWHARLATVDSQIKSLSVLEDSSWADLIAPLTTDEGVAIHALTTKKDLEKEGEDMEHCVGGYASSCILGSSHILHLSYQGHHSTLQLEETKQDGHITVNQVQHQTVLNEPPAPALIEAAKWLIEGINSNTIDINWEHIHKERSAAQEAYNKNKLKNLVGFDPLDEEQRVKAYDIMSRFCYGKMSNISRDEFIEESGLAKIIRNEINKEPTIENNNTHSTIQANMAYNL